MRKVIEKQMKIGEISIADIEFDLSCRDEIPKLLIGLQSIWCDKETRDKVFQILEELVPDDVDPNNGRRGMDLWKILVLGTVRLGCDWDYDKLQDIANNHATLRLMLGHSFTDNDKRYALQTLKDNLRLFTPELLDKINTIAVAHGHKVLGLSSEEKIDASCDSYVVETDVHFPTDTNLLWDAMRKTIVLVMRLCNELGLSGWRLGKFNLRKIKRLFMRIQRMKHSASKDEKKKEERRQLIINTHLLFLQLAQSMVDKAQKTLDSVSTNDILTILKIEEIRKYIVHAERQIDQIRRRVVDGETIPHHEKVFSIFQEHTEWISKGKIGKSVELGLKVCIIKDQFGLILFHRVMQNETDEKVAVPVIRETKARFSNLGSCSFDTGFHSPSNHEELAKLLETFTLPRKGKLSEINKEVENSEEFKRARRKHAAVESSISALENHGLDRCPDHGIDGFKRYVALGVLARNLQIIGDAIQQRQLKKEQKLRKKQNAKMVVNF